MKTEKFYLANTEKEVKLGDQIKGTLSKDGITSTILVTVDDSTIPMLKLAGIIKVVPENNYGLDIPEVINRIATRLGWNSKKVENYINSIYEIMPMAAINIILKELAVLFDEKYPDHINKSEKIYCVSSLDGRIHELCKGHIKNYRNFAAFRTIEDAKFACSILREPLKDMFKSGK